MRARIICGVANGLEVSTMSFAQLGGTDEPLFTFIYHVYTLTIFNYWYNLPSICLFENGRKVYGSSRYTLTP